MKHGLCSSVVQAEDVQLVNQRISEWFFALKPQDEYHVWLVEKIAVFSIRIDRAERMERRLRDRRSLIAEVVWDDDDRLGVEAIGRKIASKPAEIVEQLRGSPVGCDWLISRWSMLARAADVNEGKWTPEQITLAFHLLGTPLEFREGYQPGDLLDVEGRVTETGDDRAAFARREIARLLERREVVSTIDEVDKALTNVDLFDEGNPELKRLRRYESTLFNRLRWCLSELRQVPLHFKPHPDVLQHWSPVFQTSAPADSAPEPVPMPTPVSAPAPSAVVDPKPIPEAKVVSRKVLPKAAHPPFDIEPHEIPKDGSKPDLLKILIDRQEVRFTKAENRRENRRRKIEKLRA